MGFARAHLERETIGLTDAYGNATPEVEKMDGHLRGLTHRYSRQHRDVVLVEAGVYARSVETQRERAKSMGLSHTQYRRILNSAEGFLEGCLSSE